MSLCWHWQWSWPALTNATELINEVARTSLGRDMHRRITTTAIAAESTFCCLHRHLAGMHRWHFRAGVQQAGKHAPLLLEAAAGVPLSQIHQQVAVHSPPPKVQRCRHIPLGWLCPSVPSIFPRMYVALTHISSHILSLEPCVYRPNPSDKLHRSVPIKPLQDGTVNGLREAFRLQEAKLNHSPPACHGIDRFLWTGRKKLPHHSEGVDIC